MSDLIAAKGDFVLVDVKHVLWDHNLDLDEYLMETDGWETTSLPNLEWYKVVHVFDKTVTSGILGWSWMGHPLYCLIEIPPTSMIYNFCNKPFDITQKVYNQDVVTYYKIDPSVHGKIVADIFQKFIKEVKHE